MTHDGASGSKSKLGRKDKGKTQFKVNEGKIHKEKKYYFRNNFVHLMTHDGASGSKSKQARLTRPFGVAEEVACNPSTVGRGRWSLSVKPASRCALHSKRQET
ncbi:unnamed protein product [Sphenostylis stenocarpa]|uniref:Uncharacterized protein n=1 Tax=Sphenostylis stenocarpa TaxID=92480 RepID=A0AA86RZR2_9FABA|nr:unnamed protein product [Sphenostylis stenocarpa]